MRGTETWRRRLVGLVFIGVVFLVAASVLLGEHYTLTKAKEAVLEQDLRSLRAIIDQYTLQQRKFPQSVDDLVAAGYLKQLPTDPITGRSDTWVLEWSNDPKMRGIRNIHSGSHSLSRQGTAYRDW